MVISFCNFLCFSVLEMVWVAEEHLETVTKVALETFSSFAVYIDEQIFLVLQSFIAAIEKHSKFSKNTRTTLLRGFSIVLFY